MIVRPSVADIRGLDLQRSLLAGVSRTFALTIPVLPKTLEVVVGNAYLLCRIADCIEDATTLDSAGAPAFYERFVAVVQGSKDAASFAHDLARHLAPGASVAERCLIDAAPDVLAITGSFQAGYRAALGECIAVMTRGMADFQSGKSISGLATLDEYMRYCYVVAGCVGEMLTRIFIEEFPELRARRAELMQLAVSFGNCLQMTNILKDFWEDRAAGTCWLPRDVFSAEGVELAQVRRAQPNPDFARGYRRLIGLARSHAESAFAYTLAIPKRATGVRNFCLWALYMAMLTLRKLLSHPNFQSGTEVKISRLSVRVLIAWCQLAVQSDRALQASFSVLLHALPQARPEDLAASAADSLTLAGAETIK